MGDLRFFVDFDGTITTEDVVDKILERFADPSWHAIEAEWVSGKIGSRECLSRQFALVNASKAEFARLLSEIRIDPSFIDFVAYAKSADIPVIIVSDGFDVVIETVLKSALLRTPELLTSLSVYSNVLRWGPKGLEASFPETPCEHGCANCKEKVIRENTKRNEKSFFVGDGMSDRYAARTADLTFAKAELLEHCREHGLAHEAYLNFKDIENWLAKQKGKQWALQRTSS